MTLQPDFEHAATFIWSNARLLDRHRFAYHFLDGAGEQVLAALRPYQNADGGFGNALEPDLRGPVSQPQPVEFALHILDDLDAFDDPMVRQAADYLLTITTPDGGVPFVLPSAHDYPRAPWWNADADPPASINPTAAVAGLLHKHHMQHPWLGPATDYCWRSIESSDVERGGYDYLTIFTFLEFVPDRARAAQASARMSRELMASGTVTLDPGAEGHVFMPLQVAPRADSPQRQLFDSATIEQHLDALVRQQQADGGWPIGWEPPSTAAQLEWRSFVTIGVLRTLASYGRLDAIERSGRTTQSVGT